MPQLLGQWSGANSITIYAVEYFSMVGISGSSEKLLATAILGVVKFLSATATAILLIDIIGRKRSLSIGISLQFVAMLYIAIFLTVNTTVGDENVSQSPSEHRAAIGAIVMSTVILSTLGSRPN